jgi:putative SOS response-associated peptidase YedK
MLGIYGENAGADSPIRRKPAPGIISGFFEWKADGTRKRPFKIHLRDEPIMSVAGIWETWRPGTPDERHSFTILTTAANEFMREINHRMPVILARSDENAWIDREFQDKAMLKKFFKPCPSSWLNAVEVSSLVNSAKNNSPDILQPVVSDTAIGGVPRLFE